MKTNLKKSVLTTLAIVGASLVLGSATARAADMCLRDDYNSTLVGQKFSFPRAGACKPFNGYVLRVGLTNYAYTYKTTAPANDSVSHTDRQLYVLFGFNPSAWIACLLVYERLAVQSPFLIYPTYLLVWLLLPCLFALLTTFVPVLRCLGAGYLYVYNTSFLAALLLSLTFQYTRNPGFSTPFVILAVLLNAGGLLTGSGVCTVTRSQSAIDVSSSRTS